MTASDSSCPVTAPYRKASDYCISSFAAVEPERSLTIILTALAIYYRAGYDPRVIRITRTQGYTLTLKVYTFRISYRPQTACHNDLITGMRRRHRSFYRRLIRWYQYDIRCINFKLYHNFLVIDVYRYTNSINIPRRIVVTACPLQNTIIRVRYCRNYYRPRIKTVSICHRIIAFQQRIIRIIRTNHTIAARYTHLKVIKRYQFVLYHNRLISGHCHQIVTIN